MVTGNLALLGFYAVARNTSGAVSSDRMGLAENIKKARIAAGYKNAAAFARKIGVSPGKLGDWESGRYTKIRLDNLLRIANGAGCSVESLLPGIDQHYDTAREQELRDSAKNVPSVTGEPSGSVAQSQGVPVSPPGKDSTAPGLSSQSSGDPYAHAQPPTSRSLDDLDQDVRTLTKTLKKFIEDESRRPVVRGPTPATRKHPPSGVSGGAGVRGRKTGGRRRR